MPSTEDNDGFDAIDRGSVQSPTQKNAEAEGDGLIAYNTWAGIVAELNTAPSAVVFSKWVKWLRPLKKSSDAGNLFSEDRYWRLIQQGLRAPAQAYGYAVWDNSVASNPTRDEKFQLGPGGSSGRTPPVLQAPKPSRSQAGSAEQRKYCLYILSKSLSLLDQDVNTPRMAFAETHRRDYVGAYERYCTLFSTLVLDRYINQVEDCLPDLKELATPYGTVDPSWIVVLIEAALQQGVQDSVRRAVGAAFMTWDLTMLPQTDVWTDFFLLSFLPWACQGTLFTSTVTKKSRGHTCTHGEALSAFVDRLVALCEDEKSMVLLCRQLLTFMKDQGQKLVSYAAGSYILDGLVGGLRSMSNEGADLNGWLGRDDRDLVLEVATQSGLPEVARDFHLSRCTQLLNIGGLSRSTELEIPPLHQQERVEQRTVERPSPESISELQGNECLSKLGELIGKTKHQCLNGDGLNLALLYARSALAAGDLQITEDDPRAGDAKHAEDALSAKGGHVLTSKHPRQAGGPPEEVILDILSAIWEQIEIQDYPKAALMEVPETFFCANLIKKMTPNSALSVFVTNKLMEMQKFSEGRIYILAKLTTALRQLYLEAPAGVEKLAFSDFVVRFGNQPPLPKAEFQLESALSCILEKDHPERSYEAYYGEREGIGHAAFFDVLNRMRPDDHDLGLQTLNDLLALWKDQRQPVPMVSKWKTTAQLQVMLIFAQNCVDKVQAPKYFDAFLEILALEPLPRFRYLLEWIMVVVVSKEPELCRQLLAPLRKPEHENPKYLASLIKVSVHVARLAGAPQDFGLELMTAMVATCASPKIAVRHEAQWSFLILWDHAEQQRWTALTENVAFVALNAYIRCLDRYTNPPPQRLLENFDFARDNTLVNLFEGDYLKIDPCEEPVVCREDFVSVWNTDCQSLGTEFDLAIPLGEPKGEKLSVFSTENVTEVKASSTVVPETRNPLQTKSATWQTNLDLDSSLLSGASQRAVRPIIVFASHIAFAHNLGGISRAAEVFGAEGLVVAKASIVNDVAFKGVSVNSHLHLPIFDVPPLEETVCGWLEQKRLDGYGVVGVEQTDRSVVLGQRTEEKAKGNAKVFPRKCVLIMGSEKEGIPGWLLAECDICVEIPQVGVTRSLNVQTATAVALHEYGREWS